MDAVRSLFSALGIVVLVLAALSAALLLGSVFTAL